MKANFFIKEQSSRTLGHGGLAMKSPRLISVVGILHVHYECKSVQLIWWGDPPIEGARV
jgi:hypothetical protein